MAPQRPSTYPRKGVPHRSHISFHPSLPSRPFILRRLPLPSSLHYIASLLIHFRLHLPAFLDFLSPSSCARHFASHWRRTFACRQNKRLRNNRSSPHPNISHRTLPEPSDFTDPTASSSPMPLLTLLGQCAAMTAASMAVGSIPLVFKDSMSRESRLPWWNSSISGSAGVDTRRWYDHRCTARCRRRAQRHWWRRPDQNKRDNSVTGEPRYR